jgi:hypothetical protein
MKQSQQDDHFQDLADFPLGVYISLCGEAKTRLLSDFELGLLNEAGRLVAILHPFNSHRPSPEAPPREGHSVLRGS